MRRVNCSGEVGVNFSLQLSSRTQFTKIDNKKVIAENQCEKHKKSSLVKGHVVYVYWIHTVLVQNNLPTELSKSCVVVLEQDTFILA